MLTVFQLCEVKDGNVSVIDYSWEDQEQETSDIIINNKIYDDLSNTEPFGSYSIINKYKIPWNNSLFQLIEFEDDDTIKAYLKHIINQDKLIAVMYHQSPLEKFSYETSIINKKIQLESTLKLNLLSKQKNHSNLEIKPLFPNDVHIGKVLNDGLYLSSDKFFYKYSVIAKNIKNITNEFGNHAIKYIIKSNFFLGDSEVIIYEKQSPQADVCVTHMCKDHIHWKNITNYFLNKPEFELFENSGLEKKYVLQNASSLPSNISFIRVLCTIEGRVGLVTLNVNLR